MTKEAFRLIKMQTDDILLLADNKFATKEEAKLKEARFISKPREKLTPENVLLFNSYILSQEKQNMHLT